MHSVAVWNDYYTVYIDAEIITRSTNPHTLSCKRTEMLLKLQLPITSKKKSSCVKVFA